MFYKKKKIMEYEKVYLYKEDDGSYSCYSEPNARLNYAPIGEGKTVEEAKKDWMDNYQAFQASFAERGIPFEECSYSFHYDTPSVVRYYLRQFTASCLSRLTGVSEKRLAAYANEETIPTEATSRKIQAGLSNLGILSLPAL